MKKLKSLKKKNLIVYGVIALCVVVVAVLGIVSGSTETAKNPTVNITKVDSGDVSEKIDTSGNVESQNKKTFFSPVNAEISQMDFKVGDSVTSGSVLINYNLENLEKDNQKAELTALAAQYGYQDSIKKANEAAGKQAEAKQKAATLQQQVDHQKQYISDLQDSIANQTQEQQDAAAQKAAEQKANADALTEQATSLSKQVLDQTALTASLTEEITKLQQKIAAAADTGNGAAFQLSQEELAKLQLDLENKNKELKDAQSKLNDLNKQQLDIQGQQALLGAGSQTGGESAAGSSDLQSELQTAQSDLAELQSDLATNKATAEGDIGTLSKESKAQMQVNNNLQELETKTLEELIQEGRNGITAEFSGVISDTKVTNGATVSQGMEMFTLQSTEDVSVNISVSKYDYEKVKDGQKAKITIAGKEYDGTVTGISKIALPNEKGTPVLSATVHIDNPDQDIFLGVEAKVSIQAADAKNVLIVPVEVINIGNEGSFCYVIEDGAVVKKNVETGIASDTMIEVKKGLSKGDSVVTDIGTLKEGDKVDPVENSDKAKSDGKAAEAAADEK